MGETDPELQEERARCRYCYKCRGPLVDQNSSSEIVPGETEGGARISGYGS